MYMVQKPSKYDDVICEQPLTYFLIIFQMESEEGEEMEMAADVVIILIRDKSEETK